MVINSVSFEFLHLGTRSARNALIRPWLHFTR